jgi:hypothetical protein
MQLAGGFYSQQWYMRNTNGNGSTSWSELLTSASYNSYAPSLTGTGASGNWAINVTGNAATTSQRAFSGDISTTGQGRFTGWYSGGAATGAATEVGVSGGESYILGYNRDTSTYIPLNISASGANMYFNGSAINVTSGALQQGGNQVLHAGNYTSYAPSLTGSGASGTWGISITGDAGSVDGLSPPQFYNNMGQNHNTQTDFNAVSDFGARYLQGGTNGPTVDTSDQFYGFTMGLGNDYPLSQYGSQFYWPRAAQDANTYIYVRDREGGSWGSWRKTQAGYADSAGSVAWGNVSSKPSNIMYYQGFTLDANTMDSNSTGFTYSVNAPATGPVARISAGGGYDLWLNAPYSGGGTNLYFRTRNGDTATLNDWRTVLNDANYTSYAPSLTGSGASGNWGINVTGNAATATSLSTDRTNWSTNGTINDVVGQLAWKNYGNGHTIFDASNSTSPSGTGVNDTNADIGWSASYPTLMGWNGANTYGVRVDSARVADNTTGSSYSVNLGGTGNTISSSAWAGGGGYHGYTYNGGNFRFGFSSTGGVIDVYADGNFYATDSSHLVLHAGNYTSYAPSLTGSGASGNWGINITGNAATASTASNTTSISSAVGSNFIWTGIQGFQSNQNTSGSNPPLQAYSTGGAGAIMAFHRAGAYAINMGLDSDNVFRIGGWSAGANRLQMDMSGNLTMAGSVTATSFSSAGIGAGTAGLGTGSVGTYAFLRGTSGAAGPGATVAGSSLWYTDTNRTQTHGQPGGTWRLMGGSTNIAFPSVWLRIS